MENIFDFGRDFNLNFSNILGLERVAKLTRKVRKWGMKFFTCLLLNEDILEE